MFKPKNILVPTDFSGYSDKALLQAVDIAKQHGSKIYLLHINNIVQQCAVDYCLDSSAVESIERKSTTAAKKMMQKQIAKLPGAKGLQIVADVKTGTPYEEILKEQKVKKIDLIVMSSHGKTGILSHLMGSVAEKVSRAAKCQVLLVKG